MAVKIRFARGGAKKKPFYKMVIADERAPRDGDFIEKVGTYNPMLAKDHKDRIVMKQERIEHWLKQGALPTDTVANFIHNAGITLPKHVEHKRNVRIKSYVTKPSKKEQKEAAESK